MSQHYLETMYKRSDLISKAHQRRLRDLVGVFRKFVPSAAGTWADFGCSIGYIINYMVETGGVRFTKIVGYDKNEDTVRIANSRNIANTSFRCKDLDDAAKPEERYDVVSCFETLEHVPDHRIAMRTLYRHLNQDGLLIITVPNELGPVGLVKLLGRMIARKNTYEGFFDQKPWLAYVGSVLMSRPISHYREYRATGYGPHLGFDYREVVRDVEENYCKPGKLTLVHSRGIAWNTSRLLVLRRAADADDEENGRLGSPGPAGGERG
jgi:2-polyprenyl-3-methyl-5-hydroxy-6-metoxy-1,4-benzoquinol methylase